MVFVATIICLIACNGGPADHFSTFADCLAKDATLEIHAAGAALKKFQEKGIEVQNPFSFDQISPEEEDILAEKIAKSCSSATFVITDVGHEFDIKIQKALSLHAPNTFRFAYYDNPEPYVPGGYSSIAAEVMVAAQGILFSNSHLTTTSIFKKPGSEVDFGNRKKIGIGYYPIEQAEKIGQKRLKEHLSARSQLLIKNDLKENNQKVLVYFGGNNEEYFTKAFPAFLTILEEGIGLSDLSNLVIVIQQHPGAKTENLDRKRLSSWMNKQSQTLKAPKIIISDFTSDEALILADGALYYQTSLGPQFVLGGIPTIQIGHEPFEDILIKNHLSSSATTGRQFIDLIEGLDRPKKEISRALILEALGIQANWQENLKRALK